MRNFFRPLCLAAGLLAFSASACATSLLDSLARTAPALDSQVLQQALSAMQCAVRNGATPAARLAVVDYSRPSSEPRLWIFDLHEQRLLLEDYVAHGANSGDNLAERFSNTLGSHQTSLGLFRTAESYHGRHGYSLRMDGMEPGVNDRARERAIVLHGADYVDPSWIARQGRIGRSQGCPAVRREIADTVVDELKDGQFLFSWYPDPSWLETSAFLQCDARRVAGLVGGQ